MTVILATENRAGFTLGTPCSEKNVGAIQMGRQTLFFLEKNWRPF